MANENVIFNVDVKTGQSIKGVQSLKAELRQLQNALASGELEGEAFLTASKRAGQLKDNIKDTQDLVNAFNPEAKFQAFAGVIGGVANGFQVAQGAAALFGQQNAQLEQAILKTQGAMALANGLNGLLGMKDSLLILGNQVKATIPILRPFSAAMLGALTGGIAIAIVLIISYWKDIAKAIGFASESLEEYNARLDAQIEANQKAQEQFKRLRDIRISLITDENKRAKKEAEARYNDTVQQLQKEVALKQGSVDAANEIAKAAYQKYLQEIADIDKKSAAKKEELRLLRLEDEAKATKDGLDEQLALYDIQTERLKEQAKEQGRDVNQIEKDRAQERINIQTNAQEEINNKNNALLDDRLKNIDDFAKLSNESVFTSINRQKAAIENYYLTGKISQEEYTKRSIELSKQEKAARLEVADAIGNTLQSISQLAGEATAQGKALGVASAIIDTYVGANKALAQGGILGFLGAAAIIATGLANVKRILSVQVPGNSGAQSQSVAASSAQPPFINRQSNTTQLVNGNDPIVTRQLDVQTQKVIVTETDITKTQKKVSRLVSKATVG